MGSFAYLQVAGFVPNFARCHGRFSGLANLPELLPALWLRGER